MKDIVTDQDRQIRPFHMHMALNLLKASKNFGSGINRLSDPHSSQVVVFDQNMDTRFLHSVPTNT